jgi:hypothetical protein
LLEFTGANPRTEKEMLPLSSVDRAEEKEMDGDVPMPDRKALEKALAAADFAARNAGRLTEEELREIVEGAKWALHAIPKEMDFVDMCTQNPINQVYFRAGLLACREYMARFVEQGGDAATAASIRANWWPRLGDDPGAPRLYDFNEVCDEIENPDDGSVKYRAKDISPSIEALPRAHQFLAR